MAMLWPITSVAYNFVELSAFLRDHVGDAIGGSHFTDLLCVPGSICLLEWITYPSF